MIIVIKKKKNNNNNNKCNLITLIKNILNKCRHNSWKSWISNKNSKVSIKKKKEKGAYKQLQIKKVNLKFLKMRIKRNFKSYNNKCNLITLIKNILNKCSHNSWKSWISNKNSKVSIKKKKEKGAYKQLQIKKVNLKFLKMRIKRKFKSNPT